MNENRCLAPRQYRHSVSAGYSRGILPFVAIAVLGCGPRIVPVAGTVTRHGKPVPNVTVYFQPASGRPSLGNCDAEGKFTLGYTREQSGAKIGSHTVYVVYFPDVSAGPAPADFKEIYAKYGTPELSPLKVTITRATRNLEIKLD